ncbi:hypothetical protein B0H19DRAFT_1264300 [Mycena capillaripes]|nr:hypothetical protein B0H19DRAFT_1264300 [Mycena capillaripes]
MFLSPIKHQSNANARELPPPIPKPRGRRHRAPSGPWPFLDLDSEILTSLKVRSGSLLKSSNTGRIIQSLYPSWTPAQQQKSGITRMLDHASREPCTVYNANVRRNGTFTREEDFVVTEDNKEEYWENLQKEVPDEVRLQAFFLDNLSGSVLQMLGTKFDIEPFFFSSSLNWIPSRYQEAVGKGDHITLTLTFIRCMKNPTTTPPSPTSSYAAPSFRTLQSADQVIDTQAPLGLSSNDQILLPDILAIHMVRSPGLSTLISYHPPHAHHATAARTLRTRLLAAGQSVYWNNIFTSTISSDPTFVLLALLWHPLYAFDEALDSLYFHICWLESRVIETTDLKLMQQLHGLRAHLMYYASMLEEFRKSVMFVAETSNPMLEHMSDTHSLETTFVKELLRRDSRLKNVMNLAFISLGINDGRRMQKLTEATVRDSTAMRQISYLTMFFLPASFAASIFGMNVNILTPGTSGTLAHYFALALPMTGVTIWLLMTFQYRNKDKLGSHAESQV